MFITDVSFPDEVLDECFNAGKDYWISFGMSSRGKELLRRITDTETHLRALALFQHGFAGRMILTNHRDGIEPELLPLVAALRWRDYLRSCIGEVVLDGPPWPDTPDEVRKLAFEFFIEGFRAADCDLVCREAESKRR